MPTQTTDGLPLAGKVFAVTGGARGIGAAICATLHARGAIAVPFDIDPAVESLNAAVAGLFRSISIC